MTYFQLYDSLQAATPIRAVEPERVPSSSFLLNPTLVPPAQISSATRLARPQLRPKLYLVPMPKSA